MDIVLSHTTFPVDASSHTIAPIVHPEEDAPLVIPPPQDWVPRTPELSYRQLPFTPPVMTEVPTIRELRQD